MSMADSPTTAMCPCPHERPLAAGYECVLCGMYTSAGRVPPDLAAAYRLGSYTAVWLLVEAHPEDYPEVHTRIHASLGGGRKDHGPEAMLAFRYDANEDPGK